MPEEGADKPKHEWLSSRTTHGWGSIGVGLTLMFGSVPLGRYVHPDSTPWWVPGGIALGAVGVLFGLLLFALPGVLSLVTPRYVETRPVPPKPKKAKPAPTKDPAAGVLAILGPTPAEQIADKPRELILVVVDKYSYVGWHYTAPDVAPRFKAECRIHVNNRLGETVRLLKVRLVEAGVWGDLWERGQPSVYFSNASQGYVRCEFSLNERAVPEDSRLYTGTVEFTDDTNRTHAVSVTFSVTSFYDYDPETGEPY